MACYLLGAIDIRDEDGYARYREQTIPLLTEIDGLEILAVDGARKIYEGTQPAEHMFIIRFPDRAAADRFMESPAYQQAAGHRRSSAKTHFIMAMDGMES